MKKIIILFLFFSLFFFYSRTGAFSLKDFQKYLDEDKTRVEEVMKQLLYRKIYDFKKYSFGSGIKLKENKNYIKKQDILILRNYLLKHYPSLKARKVSKNDDGLTKYIGPDVFYTSKIYKPKDLQDISPSYYLVLTDDREQIRKQAYIPLEKLAKAYYRTFKKPLQINSARRSYFYQQNHFNKECFEEKVCAVPGTSEHQNGYAIDISHMYGDEYLWMKENAHYYGFHQSYQKEGDGLQIEPWHRRYLGVGLATELWNRGISFTDYYQEDL